MTKLTNSSKTSLTSWPNRLTNFSIPSFSNSYSLIDEAKDLSQVKKVSPPTLVHLLTHTSGLSYAFNDSLVGKAYAEKSRISRQEEKLQQVLEQNTEAINDLKIQILEYL